MTADNVLSVCNSLEQLELDYNAWNLLTDDQKKISNDFCMQKYGMNNIEFYQKQKQRLTILDEAFHFINNGDEMKSFKDKMDQTRLAVHNDPMNVVIIPLVDVDPMSVDTMYHNYLNLPQQFKNLSNGLSLKIWGVTVDDAYKKVKGLSTDNRADIDLDEVNDDNPDTFIEASLMNINNILEGKSERVEFNTKYDFTNDIPQIVPLLTYTEYCALFPEKRNMPVTEYINIDEPKKYYAAIEAMQIQLEKAKKKDEEEEFENLILKSGWFPYRKINGDSIKDARERQADWFNNNMQTNIIDLTDTDLGDSDGEATSPVSENNDLFEVIEMSGIDGDKSRLEPLFITFTSSDNFLGKVIKKWTKSHWSHAGIALQPKLDKIYTFSAKELNENNKQGGFRIESLELYSSLNITDLLVMCFFVDKDIKKKVKEELAFYEKNQANTKYDKLNYFNIAFNIQKDDESMQMVCSQFVDYILKMAGVDITNKASNLVTPADLSKTDNNAINIYALFEGKIPNYKEKDIKKKIKFIVDTLDYSKLCATTTENMKNTTKTSKVIECFFNVCTNNEEINEILRQMRLYVNPDSLTLKSYDYTDIKVCCSRNHDELMKCGHADTGKIKVLLYENRGLALYIQPLLDKDKEFAKCLEQLNIDFEMYKGILDNKNESLSNLSGFAKYYADQIEKLSFKYDGSQTI